jgi:hypothetical protein
VQTIGQGIANALTLGNGQPVFVAEGNYPEKVTLVEGVDLLGGHQCDGNSCTWVRDFGVYDSRILAQDDEGVLAPDSITRATRIDGFTIVGQDGNPGNNNNITAMTVNLGTPTITNNVVVGAQITGACSWCGTNGLRVIGPANAAEGTLISNNELRAGDSPASSTGLVLETHANPVVAEVTDNWIKGGEGNWTRAINAFGAAAGKVIARNEIFAGDALNSGTSFAMIVSGELTIDANWINHDPLETGSCPQVASWYFCGGIEAEGVTATITNNVVYGMNAPGGKTGAVFISEGEVPFGFVRMNANTLHGAGGSAALSFGIGCRTSQGTNATIGNFRNNILTGGQGSAAYGFYEDDQTNGRTCEPTEYENNALYGGTAAHRQWTGAGAQNVLATFAEVNMLSYAQGNLGMDCMLDSTDHLISGSPCINAGVAFEAPPVDIDGDARPQLGVTDIGADEAL